MLKYLPVIAGFLLLLCSTHATALDWLGDPEGKAIETDGLKSAATLSINGTKFDDSNRNAVFDVDERGLSGWVIRLKLDGREISNTTTDESGRYSFTNLKPGEYTVVEDQEAGWEQSVPGSGYYTINLIDENADKVDFGSSRFPKAPDEKGTGVHPDVEGTWTDVPLFPGMQEEEEELTKTLPPTYIDPNS